MKLWIKTFAWLASILAIIEIVMQLYADYAIFSIFVTSWHTFLKFNFINWPYYVFPIGIVLLTWIKKYSWLLLVLFLMPTIINYQIYYLYTLWSSPNTMTFGYTKILAIIVCSMAFFALLSGLLSVVNLKSK